MGYLSNLALALTGRQPNAQAVDSHALFAMMSAGAETAAGVSVSARSAMKNTTVLRCVSLISFSIGMLPLHLIERDTKQKADTHPLFRLLHRKPNGWQTPFEFRSLMQQRALVEGDSFALIVRSGTKPIALVPIANSRVTVKQRPDWSLEYRITDPSGGQVKTFEQRDIFHLRYGLSEDGYTGLSLVRQAAEAIGLALQLDRAAGRLFRNGMIVGATLKHPGKLSPEAFERLKASMAAREGADNAHKSLVLEEGMDMKGGGDSAADSQHIEQRKQQIEEIARPFGVPRPLLGVDDTSWGSGIDVLGQFFVRYALGPWFVAWEQAVQRSLMTDAEADRYEVKFNPGALLRGSMKDQADFFARALGSGGHQPWMHWDEVRTVMDLPARERPLATTEMNGGANEPA